MDVMTVHVLWDNSKTIKAYEFVGNKYQFRKYCQGVERKGGRVLDPFGDEDSKLIRNFEAKEKSEETPTLITDLIDKYCDVLSAAEKQLVELKGDDVIQAAAQLSWNKFNNLHREIDTKLREKSKHFKENLHKKFDES